MAREQQSIITSSSSKQPDAPEYVPAPTQAEVSLDEYLGVMIDLGWSKSGNTLFTADIGVRPCPCTALLQVAALALPPAPRPAMTPAPSDAPNDARVECR